MWAPLRKVWDSSRGNAGSNRLLSESGVMICIYRCGSDGGDTGATTGPGCLSRVLFSPISTGDIVVWFEGQYCPCNANTFQSQTASVKTWAPWLTCSWLYLYLWSLVSLRIVLWAISSELSQIPLLKWWTNMSFDHLYIRVRIWNQGPYYFVGIYRLELKGRILDSPKVLGGLCARRCK